MFDWPTVIAQALNFLILVFLLQRFLYKPILRTLDAREARIADSLKEAEESERRARAQQDAFEERSRALDEARGALLDEARQAADAERARLLEEARTAAQTLRASLEEQTRDEFDALREGLRVRAAQEVFETARQVLRELAGISLETQIVERFLGELRVLPPEQEEALRASAAKSPAAPAVAASAFSLAAPLRESLRSALAERFGVQALAFEERPELIGGLQLTLGDEQISWSVEDYLDAMEQGIEAAARSAEHARG